MKSHPDINSFASSAAGDFELFAPALQESQSQNPKVNSKAIKGEFSHIFYPVDVKFRVLVSRASFPLSSP
jgi:hypothetical protein